MLRKVSGKIPGGHFLSRPLSALANKTMVFVLDGPAIRTANRTNSQEKNYFHN